MAGQLGQGPSGLYLCPGAGLLHSHLCTSPARDNWHPGSALTPRFGADTTIFFPGDCVQPGIARRAGSTGIEETLLSRVSFEQ